MQRSVFLFLLSLGSVTFLWLQISIFTNIEHSRKDLYSFVPSFILRGWKEHKQDVERKLLVLVQDFEEACVKNRVTTFLIDPVILKSILQEVPKNRSTKEKLLQCIHFCHRNSVSYGVFASFWNANLLDDLQKKNIRTMSLTGQDPRPSSGNNNRTTTRVIPLHFVFIRHQLVIHVTIFYDRGVLGLWHGSISDKDFSSHVTTYIKTNSEQALAFFEDFRNEGVLNRFSLRLSRYDGIQVWFPSAIEVFLRDLDGSKFLPCNIKRAQEFYSKYGDDGSKAASVFRKRGKEVLQIAKMVLDRLGVQFWLSSGTCLGWFRQCNVISHGKDMDIGIWIKDYNERLVGEFLENGLYLEHRFGKIEDSFQMSFRTIDNVKLDIFFFYEEGLYMWNGGTQAKSGRKFKYIFPNFSLCWTEFLGMKVRVPCKTQVYIEANYGTSWAVPIKQWDWKKSPPNVRENGKWAEKEWPEVIQFFELQ